MATNTKATAEAGSDGPVLVTEIRDRLVKEDKYIARIDKKISELKDSFIQRKQESDLNSRKAMAESRELVKLAKRQLKKMWDEIQRAEGAINKMAKEASFYHYKAARKRIASINARRVYFNINSNLLAQLKVKRTKRMVKLASRAASIKLKIDQEAFWIERMAQLKGNPEIRIVTPTQYNELIKESARKLIDNKRIYGFKDSSGKETKEEG